MYEVNLVCPVCGNYEFSYDPETNKYECSECSWSGSTNEMNIWTNEI